MRNDEASKERRRRVANENAAEREKRDDGAQLRKLAIGGFAAKKETARLEARITARKEEK